MHRFAHWVVAAERERHVADAAADERTRQTCFDLSCRLDEGNPVAVMLGDTRGNCKDVRIEDDVLRRESDLADEQLVRALTDFELALDAVGLTLLVECHDDDCGAEAQTSRGLALEKVPRLP